MNLNQITLNIETLQLKSPPHLVVTAAAEENSRGKPVTRLEEMDLSRGERRRSPRLSASSRPAVMATSTPLTPVAEERRAAAPSPSTPRAAPSNPRAAPSTPASSTLSNASSLSSKGSPRLQGNVVPRLSDALPKRDFTTSHRFARFHYIVFRKCSSRHLFKVEQCNVIVMRDSNTPSTQNGNLLLNQQIK